MNAPAVTYGAFLVYAGTELEGEPKTRAGANRMRDKLVRLGFVVTVKRHATDGTRHWNEVVS